MGRDFSRERLYDECEEFIEELLNDAGKPWYYSAKRDAERIFDKIPHALGIKELERYEFELEELKEKVKRRTHQEPFASFVDAKSQPVKFTPLFTLSLLPRHPFFLYRPVICRTYT
ncbi:MAG: hypothetical protein ACXQTW_07470 [Candidatus Methanospirareceae archaeon]